jgi:hypothetical protein
VRPGAKRKDLQRAWPCPGYLAKPFELAAHDYPAANDTAYNGFIEDDPQLGR